MLLQNIQIQTLVNQCYWVTFHLVVTSFRTNVRTNMTKCKVCKYLSRKFDQLYYKDYTCKETRKMSCNIFAMSENVFLNKDN